MRRLRAIFLFITSIVLFTTFGSFGGQRIVGFRYGVSVNNLSADFPSTVINLDGARITLDDGRVLKVSAPQSDWLAEEMKSCENHVRFDAATGMFYTMRYAAYCGFDRPQRCQLITIPLIRVNMPQYWSREFADARQIRSEVENKEGASTPDDKLQTR